MTVLSDADRVRYAERRAGVLAQLGDSACLILAASPELHGGADTELRYVIDSDLYYLTGYTEPDAVLVLADGAFTFFVRPRDPQREQWTGARGGVEAALAVFGADTAFPIAEIARELPRIGARMQRIYMRTRGGRDDVDAVLRDVLTNGRRARARSGRGPMEVADHGLILDEMRLHKDAHEIALIRRAADISVAAFREAARHVCAGNGEWQVEAALQAGFRSRRASGEAFPSIVGAGANATVLHYITNNGVICDGDLVLVDAGARFDMYCADITRTWAAGTVSPERRAVHDAVRAAHGAAVGASREGATIDGVDLAARRVLVQGLIDLGLVDGPLTDALARDDYKRYFPHRTSHWLGLDVHDVGAYRQDDSERPLVNGMVYTIEPGLYIPADDPRARPGLRGVGVRLEDDVLIDRDGADVLTRALSLDMEPGAA